MTPLLTAELSLYQTRRRYGWSTAMKSATGRAVVPQRLISPNAGFTCGGDTCYCEDLEDCAEMARYCRSKPSCDTTRPDGVTTRWCRI
jgi:hypothetical protein